MFQSAFLVLPHITVKCIQMSLDRTWKTEALAVRPFSSKQASKPLQNGPFDPCEVQVLHYYGRITPAEFETTRPMAFDADN